MHFRKRDFSPARKAFPPLPAGHFFCRSCSTIRAEAQRQRQTRPLPTVRLRQSGEVPREPRGEGLDQTPIDQNSVEHPLTKSPSTKRRSTMNRKIPELLSIIVACACWIWALYRIATNL